MDAVRLLMVYAKRKWKADVVNHGDLKETNHLFLCILSYPSELYARCCTYIHTCSFLCCVIRCVCVCVHVRAFVCGVCIFSVYCNVLHNCSVCACLCAVVSVLFVFSLQFLTAVGRMEVATITSCTRDLCVSHINTSNF